MPGPRQRVDGTRYENPIARIDSASTSFLTRAAALEHLLPPGFSLADEPVVTVEFMFISELQWLAGRGYNTVGVRFPVRYRGAKEQVCGPLLAVLWENKADPIITGREELGFSKLFCDIPPPRVLGSGHSYAASWEGHRFLDMTISDLQEAPVTPAAPTDGMLHYKYMPRTGEPGIADVSGAAISPPTKDVSVLSHAVGNGDASFHRSTWEQLPTLFHIVNTLADLPVLEPRGAVSKSYRANTELSNQRMLS
jgi:hypothetical protein